MRGAADLRGQIGIAGARHYPCRQSRACNFGGRVASETCRYRQGARLDGFAWTGLRFHSYPL